MHLPFDERGPIGMQEATVEKVMAEAARVEPDDLLRRMGSAKIELIILNACLTEQMCTRLCRSGVPLAVGWSTKAIAFGAATFSTSFLESWLSGANPSQALKAAEDALRQRVALSDEHKNFKVGVDPDSDRKGFGVPCVRMKESV